MRVIKLTSEINSENSVSELSRLELRKKVVAVAVIPLKKSLMYPYISYNSDLPLPVNNCFLNL